MKKIDIHCHVLPGIDDGAKNKEESLAMLREAYSQGICSVFATSHASASFPKSQPDRIRKFCRLLEKDARQEISPDFCIYPGQEIMYTEDMIARLDRGELLTLAESSWVLVEFYPNTPYSVIYRAMREFAMTRYTPVLAHVERYGALRKEGRVEELIQAGARIQMNYQRIGGKWYDETTRWCRRMLLDNHIHFLATDMHDRRERPPSCRAAMHWMEHHLDEEYLEELCFRNAERFLLSVGSGYE